MRLSLVIAFLGFLLIFKAQSVKVDRVVHDFGLVKTWEGIQTTEFIITNQTSEVLFFDDAQTSCGCSVVTLSKKSILTNDTCTALVILDPSKEDGVFTKSISLFFHTSGDEKQALHMNLTGLALTAQHMKELVKKSAQKEENVLYYYQQTEDLDQFDFKSEAYEAFVEKAVKEALFNQNVKILITIYNTSEKYSFEKVLSSAYKKLKKDISHEGIPEEKIIFINPLAELSSNQSYIQLSIIERDENSEMISVESEVDTTIGASYKGTYFPVYFQLFTGGVNNLDTTITSFQEFIESLYPLLPTDKKTTLLLYSSSSLAPNPKGYSAKQTALLRGERVEKTLIDYLMDTGKDTSLISIAIIPITGGPEFSTRFYPVEYYYKYQFIKMVPSFESYLPNASVSFRHQYVQHFYSQQNYINTQSDDFLALLKVIEEQIQSKGWVNLILESSASKIPTNEYRSNEVLAYSRITEIKNAVNKTLYQKGIDIRKINFTVERTLIQGLEKDDSKPESAYIPFQYIKVLVE